ncbi:hypothetical protein CBR_g34751 [Chara braunii]|uniref:DUF659 domain-containing protein n=1 Tax=Chara braunii TaxID=69332 RepID=A0A388LJ78_CHABU|nr:hypothetical protein CBR_g34751 [Chara braunii]|eukprot:GBG82376.1 hypothetical protein CBR_g34751 [Chara braunii]
MRDDAVGGPDLPGEEVVMTSRGVEAAGHAARASQPDLDHTRREKRKVGEEDVDVRDTTREKRARQTTIEEMYDKEKLAEFSNVWLQWIYGKGLPFNAFRGPEFQRVPWAVERVPRIVRFQFPSYRVTAGAGIPSQRKKVASMASEVPSAFQHTGATILSDGRKSRSGKPLVNFLAGDVNGALLYATVARDGSVRDTVDVVYRRWRTIILFCPGKDVIGFCTYSASNYTAVARRFATDPDADIRRITWLPCSTHVRNLMLSDVGTRGGWVKETIIRARALVRFIKSHDTAHTLFRRMSHRVMLVEPVETRFASVFLMLTCLKGRQDALESMLYDDAWAHILWERRLLAQAQWQGGGYVLPWVMGTGREGTAGGEEDDKGDVEPEVWGTRPAGSVNEQDIERHVVAFHACRSSRGDPVQDVFGKRATELRPWPEYTAGADGTPDADADDDTGDATAERVYFTNDGGLDGMAPQTSVNTDDVSSGGQGSATGRAGDRRGRRPRGDEDVEENEPLRGLRQTSRRWEVRSNKEPEREDEEEAVPRQDRRYSPSHHWTTGPPQSERRSARLASAAERQRMHDSEDREGARPVDMPDVERTPSGASLLPRSPGAGCPAGQTGGGVAADFARMGGSVCVSGGAASTEGVGGRGGGGGDASDVDVRGEAVVGEVREGVVREDIDVGGGGEGVPAGDEGQGVAVAGGGEGGPGGDVDGDHLDEDEDGSDDHDGSGDNGGDDDEEMLVLVVRDPTLPLLRPDDLAQVMLDVDDLVQVGTQDPFPHTGRRSGERRPSGGAYSPPPYLVQSPRWSGSSLSGIRGRESGVVEGGSGRRSDGGGSAESMPPPPARAAEASDEETTARAHIGGSPPPVRGGVVGGWAAH